jgi:Zn-dependent protease
MPEFILKAGLALPFLLLLLALMGLRRTVTPRATVVVKAPIDKVFALVDFYDGKIQNWNRTKITFDLIDAARQIFRMTFATTLSTGSAQTSQALFRVASRRAPHYIELVREGLEGKSHNNELLKIIYETTEEAGGTRLNLAYHWGSRPIIAQLLARADLWGGIYRLKGLAETGKPDETTHMLISLGISVATGLLTFMAFGLMTGWEIAGLLLVALIVHEFGHLLAYRLIGQPWGRMIFLPFLGAIAVPRLAYESQGQAVFSALMGPALSAVLSVGVLLTIALDFDTYEWTIRFVVIAAALNLFNLLPVEPLDGGVALRSVLAKLMGRHARFGLMSVGLLIIAAGLYFQQVVLLVFGGISVLANIKPRVIDSGLTPLTSLQVSIAFFGYVAITITYIGVLRDIIGTMA